MEAKDELAVLFRELPLKAGDEPEVRYRMEAYRPELFGSPSPAPGYCVNKVVQKNTGRRTVYSLVETCQPKGGSIANPSIWRCFRNRIKGARTALP